MTGKYDVLKKNVLGRVLASGIAIFPNVAPAQTPASAPTPNPDVTYLASHTDIGGNTAKNIVNCLVDKGVMPQVSEYWWGWGATNSVTITKPSFGERGELNVVPIIAKRISPRGNIADAVIIPQGRIPTDPKNNYPLVLLHSDYKMDEGVYREIGGEDRDYNPNDPKARQAAQEKVDEAVACVEKEVPGATNIMNISDNGSKQSGEAPKQANAPIPRRQVSTPGQS